MRSNYLFEELNSFTIYYQLSLLRVLIYVHEYEEDLAVDNASKNINSRFVLTFHFILPIHLRSLDNFIPANSISNTSSILQARMILSLFCLCPILRSIPNKLGGLFYHFII
ncbi:hypothetical protein CVS40_6802 [Lucilia cuprina]|nr:hypothetical protein CVS40_6802 [Lucilia cuprina]